MKTSNKGFSLVELIIVIAIMAILAGALAPALIKYINKSRLSTDIQTANTIATAIQTALSSESAYDSAQTYDDGSYHAIGSGSTWNGSTNNSFYDSISNTIGGKSAPKVKSKKCARKTGATATGGDFYFYVNRSNNEVKVCIGANSGSSSHIAYPTASDCLSNEEATACTPG